MANEFSPSAQRTAAALMCLGLLVLAGCETERYSSDMIYPLRDDVIVDKIPETQPAGLDQPGRLDQWVRGIGDHGGRVLDPAGLAVDQRQQLTRALNNLFGTPAEPKVEGLDSDPDTLQQIQKDFQLDAVTLAQGSQLYRRHCLHCHGLTGNGRGPTGPWVNPHPRDYRQGQFKFTSVSGGNDRKPTREDLARVIRQGVEGTSMPAFLLLTDQEVNALVSYVIHLSLRGQVEYEITKSLLDKTLDADSNLSEEAQAKLDTVWNRQWVKSQDRLVTPQKPPTLTGAALEESIRRGYKEFLTGKAQCVKCHNDFGRANDFRYDVWGTIVRPANLTAGIYRGGRRPVDLFWRIHTGVKPSGMPDFGDSLKPEEIWDVVHFLQALPYPKMLPDDIRDKVYPNTEPKAVASAN